VNFGDYNSNTKMRKVRYRKFSHCYNSSLIKLHFRKTLPNFRATMSGILRFFQMVYQQSKFTELIQNPCNCECIYTFTVARKTGI